MSTKQYILTNTAERLGIQDDTTLNKATEFIRVFQSKGQVIKTLNDQAKAVLCLDLALSYSGATFDKETAIKLSGLKKSVYQNTLHTVEKVLEIDKQLTVSELCVQLGCTGLKELAEEILSKYKNNSKGKDVCHPQYVAAAVHAACKVKKEKVAKAHLVAASHLKPTQWKELCNEFEKFVTTFGIGSPRKRKKDDTIKGDDIVNDSDKVKLERKEGEDAEVEDYEIWKKRILEEAYEALKLK